MFPNITVQQQFSLNFRHLWEPKYSAEPPRAALQGVFGNKLLKESKCRLLIPAYDVVAGRIFLFKTRHDPRFLFDENASAVEIALTTAAVPTFCCCDEGTESVSSSYRGDSNGDIRPSHLLLLLTVGKVSEETSIFFYGWRRLQNRSDGELCW